MILLFYLKGILQLILSPRKGWEDISYDGFHARELFRKGFMPLVCFCSLSVFLRLFYHADASFAVVLEQAVVCVLKYLVAYYIAAFVFSVFMPVLSDNLPSLSKVHTFLIYSLGLMITLNIAMNCIPMDVALLYLLPLYFYFIMWRGIGFMAISFKGAFGFLMCCGSILVPPIVIQFLFNLVIPAF
ncbi:MAG: hypothetical protein K2M94_08770 [Paramuribaculum sp.]|nr:hypothetical protein [Paramuribaculum sp.]